MTTPAGDGHVEIEWQFDAPSVRRVEAWLRSASLAAGFRVTSSPVRHLVDLYCDTEDWRLYRAGHALRLRSTGDEGEATLKALASGGGETSRRREIDEPLPVATLAALARAHGPVAARVRLIAGRRPLRPLVEVRTRRHPWLLARGGRVVAEIALDASVLPGRAGARPLRLSRVEVEARDADPALLAPVVALLREGCGLVRSPASKYETALAASGLVPSPAPDLGPTTIDASSAVGEVGFATLRRHFAALCAHEPGTRLGEDPEALHDMRVANRRVRAALKTFAPFLPPRARWLRCELGWLDDALAATRDLDVQIARFAEWGDAAGGDERRVLERVRAILWQRRERARRRLLRALDAPRFARLMAVAVPLLRRGPGPRSAAARTPALAVAPDLIRRRHRAVRRLGDRLAPDSPAPAYHALRKACRSLRYTLECHLPIYGKPVRRLIKALTALQDLLGLHQDAAVAAEHLRRIGRDADLALTARARMRIGRLAERTDADAARLREGFPARYRTIRGKRWRRLRRALAG